MPYSSPHYCYEAGCNQLVKTPRCDKHTVVRTKIADPFYKSMIWTTIRTRKLMQQPTCEYRCDDNILCGRTATDVDHIVSRRNGGTNEPHNLQSLCHAHHARLTAMFDGGFGNKTRVRSEQR